MCFWNNLLLSFKNLAGLNNVLFSVHHFDFFRWVTSQQGEMKNMSVIEYKCYLIFLLYIGPTRPSSQISEYRIKIPISKNVRKKEPPFPNGRETDFALAEERTIYCHKKSWTEIELRDLPGSQTDCKENPVQPAVEGICSAADSSGYNPSLWWLRKMPRSLSKPLSPWNCWNPLSLLGDQWHWDHRKFWLWESSLCRVDWKGSNVRCLQVWLSASSALLCTHVLGCTKAPFFIG